MINPHLKTGGVPGKSRTGIGLVLDWFWTGLEAILDWFWTGFGLVLDWFGSKRNTPFHDYTRNTHDTFYHQNQNQQITHLTSHPSIGFPSLLPLTTFRCISAPGHVPHLRQPATIFLASCRRAAASWRVPHCLV